MIQQLVPTAVRFCSDLKKDLNSWLDRRDLSRAVWVCGLAKSGTSLIENILSEVGYVDGARSLIRPRSKFEGRDFGFVTQQFFDDFPKYRKTYYKTHTPFNDQFLECMKGVMPLVMVRDVRDALVSRYFHIMSDPNHWDYERLISVKAEDRFKASVLAENPVHGICQMEYYIKWVASWVKSDLVERVLCFEDYKKDPVLFTEKILRIIGEDSALGKSVEERLEQRREKIRSYSGALSQRRKRFGSESGTFRNGTVGEFVEFFDNDLQCLFDELQKKYELE